MESTNHLTEVELQALADGQTATAEASSHLQACVACQQRCAAMRGPRSAAAVMAPIDSAAPVSFGKFHGLERLAQGGMGIVYKAWQTKPRRQVALKVIRPGRLDSDRAIRRFLAEADALAEAAHPNILPIYEAGTHEGQHYFTMKLVDGGALSEQLRQALPAPLEGARLVARIARAVHFAHQRGLLHRDLKPANILIGRDGFPYVTDFGLAKWLERQEAPEGAVSDGFATASANRDESAPGAVLGTPAYMAPEQASGDCHTIATDVYGLGAILHEVMTGQPPLQEKLLKNSPADLDAVCRKCLATNPEDRYASAEELARDLDRFASHEPVSARPLSSLGRASRWVRRKPALAAFYGTLALALIGGLIGSLLHSAALASALASEEIERRRADDNYRLAVKEGDAKERQRQQAIAEKQRAEEALAKAVTGVEYWLKISDKLARHSVTKEIKDIRQKMLEEGLSYFQDLLKLRPEDPLMERELANVYNRLGFFHRGWPEERAQALACLHKAVELLERAGHKADPASQLALAKASNNLAGIHRDDYLASRRPESYQKALACLQRSVAIWTEREKGENPASLSTSANLSMSMNNTVGLMIEAGKEAEARVLAEKALAKAQRGQSLYPRNILVNSALAHAHANQGMLLERAGEFDAALSDLHKALDINRLLVKEQPGSEERHATFANNCYNLALVSWKNYKMKGVAADLQTAKEHAREGKNAYEFLTRTVGPKKSYQAGARRCAELLQRASEQGGNEIQQSNENGELTINNCSGSVCRVQLFIASPPLPPGRFAMHSANLTHASGDKRQD